MKYFKLFIIFIFVLLFPLDAFAHSGDTDEYGGHYNYSNGSYHYHHGKSAHQHPNGVCPYGDKYNTKPNTSADKSDREKFIEEYTALYEKRNKKSDYSNNSENISASYQEQQTLTIDNPVSKKSNPFFTPYALPFWFFLSIFFLSSSDSFYKIKIRFFKVLIWFLWCLSFLAVPVLIASIIVNILPIKTGDFLFSVLTVAIMYIDYLISAKITCKLKTLGICTALSFLIIFMF